MNIIMIYEFTGYALYSFFDVKANIHNKFLRRYAINQSKELEGISFGQYGR